MKYSDFRPRLKGHQKIAYDNLTKQEHGIIMNPNLKNFAIVFIINALLLYILFGCIIN